MFELILNHWSVCFHVLVGFFNSNRVTCVEVSVTGSLIHDSVCLFVVLILVFTECDPHARSSPTKLSSPPQVHRVTYVRSTWEFAGSGVELRTTHFFGS